MAAGRSVASVSERLTTAAAPPSPTTSRPRYLLNVDSRVTCDGGSGGSVSARSPASRASGRADGRPAGSLGGLTGPTVRLALVSLRETG